jgi:predicted site-specific integrase-resolvase
VRASDLVSAADIAARLGVATNTVTKWHHRGLLPPPVAVVKRRTMRLWSWEAVETWAQSTGRLSVAGESHE